MTIRSHISCILFLIAVLNSSGQIQHWNYEPIQLSLSTSNNYLRDNEIVDGTVDQNGLIWLITLFGVVTFDGERHTLHPDFQSEEIRYYTLNARAIISDDFNRIWLLTDDRGVVMFDYRSKRFTLFNKHNNAHIQLDNDHIHDLFIENEHVIWLANDDFKICRIQLKKKTTATYDALAEINNIVPEAKTGRFGQILADNNILWIGCQWGIVKFDRLVKSMHFIPFNRDVQYNDPPLLTMALYKHNDDLFIAPQFSSFHGIVILNTNTEQFNVHVQAPTQVNHEDVFCSFTRWSENTLIAGARRQGYMLIDLQDYSMERIYGHAFGMPYPSIQEIYKIHRVNESLAYFISYLQIIKVSKKNNPFHFYYLNVDDGLKHNWQGSFLEDPQIEGFLLGTSFGDGILPVDLSGDKITPIRYQSQPGQYDFDITFHDMIHGPNDTIWLGTSSGLLFLDLPNRKIISPASELANSPVGNSTIHELYYFHPHVFISTQLEGFYQYQVETKHILEVGIDSNYKINHRPLVNEVLRLSDSTFWITTSDGLRHFNPQDGRLKKFKELDGHTLDQIELRYALQYDGHIYIASAGSGLFDISYQNNVIDSIVNYTNKENILYNKLAKIILDEKNESLWLNTGDGFSQFHLPTKHFTNYSISEGIGFRSRDGKNFYHTKDGLIIAGAYRHFQYFHPDSVSKSFLKTQPYLRSFSADDVNYPIRSFTSDTIVLSKENNTFEFSMRAINHNSNSLNYYSYQLAGFDQSWSPPNQEPLARYTKIPGGDYIFSYRVANKNLDWSNGQPLYLSIEKKITEFTSFWVVLALFCLTSLYFAYRWRLAQVRAKAEIEREFSNKINELELDALRLQMNPHFIFNSINSINWFIIQNDRDNASNYLTKFSRLIRLSLENSKSKLIPLSNEIDAISIYLAMEKLRFEDRFNFEIIVEGHFNTSSILIPPMIIQPYVENAIWHGIMNKKGHGRIVLTLKVIANKLICTVEDDGIGREAAHQINNKKIIQKQSLGMKITEDRLRYIEQAYQIETKTRITDLYNEEGKAGGTRVVIEIPQIKNTQETHG